MNITMNQKNNDFLNEATAQFLETIFQHFAHERAIDDTDWQVVYDLKSNVINSLEGLGFTIKEEEG